MSDGMAVQTSPWHCAVAYLLNGLHLLNSTIHWDQGIGVSRDSKRQKYVANASDTARQEDPWYTVSLAAKSRPFVLCEHEPRSYERYVLITIQYVPIRQLYSVRDHGVLCHDASWTAFNTDVQQQLQLANKIMLLNDDSCLLSRKIVLTWSDWPDIGG